MCADVAVAEIPWLDIPKRPRNYMQALEIESFGSISENLLVTW